MDSQLQAMLGQTIKIANQSSVNNYGEPQWSSAASHSARIIGRQELVMGSERQEILSEKQLILSSTVTVNLQDRIWLPGESTASDTGWMPLAAATRVDESGNTDYYKVWLGRRVS